MRKTMMTSIVAGLVIVAPGMMMAAAAQSNPNAAQLINALKPTGSLSDTTRGIRPLAPGNNTGMSQVNGKPTPAAMSMPMAASSPRSANLDIDFQPGSANLTPGAAAELDQLGKALTSSDLASYHFKIVGHTDTTGDTATNQTLSDQRAQAVKTYLESKFNVPDVRLQAQGVGESDLLIKTPPQTSELKNRRVQIINLGQ